MYGGSWVQFRSGTQIFFFSLFHALSDMQNIPTVLFLGKFFFANFERHIWCAVANLCREYFLVWYSRSVSRSRVSPAVCINESFLYESYICGIHGSVLVFHRNNGVAILPFHLQIWSGSSICSQLADHVVWSRAQGLRHYCSTIWLLSGDTSTYACVLWGCSKSVSITCKVTVPVV